jgi:predicted ATPase
MITRIVIDNFKSLKHVDVRLGAFNLFVGTNASGKSNFLDALRFLQGVGYGFNISEILDGKPKGPASVEWEPIRGGSALALFRNGDPGAEMVGLAAEFSRNGVLGTKYDYSIEFDPRRRCVRRERLTSDDKRVYDSAPTESPTIVNDAEEPVFRARYYRLAPGVRGRKPDLDFEKARPVLHQLARHPETGKEHKQTVEDAALRLANMQRLDVAPAVLRGYSTAQTIGRMGERGENFAALVRSIVADKERASAYCSWLNELRPVEVEEVLTLPGAVNEPMFALRETGRKEPFPAPGLSDGTLRFAAIAAAFFQPDMPEVLTIEEIENGIHPARMRVLLELLRNRAGQAGVQVMATTHSPLLLDWLRPDEWASAFFCRRDPQSGAATIRPLTDIPGFREAARPGHIGELMAEGWMEFAL